MPTDPTTYAPASPFARPSRRWDAAGAIIAGERLPRSVKREPLIQAAVTFRRRRGRPRRDGSDLQALVEAARAIYAPDDPLRWEVEARLLAEEPLDEIAQHTGVPAEVLNVYGGLFFDIRDEDGHLRGLPILHVRVVREAAADGGPDEAGIWRILALIGGPMPLNVVVADYHGRVEPAFEDRDTIVALLRLLARLEATSGPAETLELLAEARRLRPGLGMGLELQERMLVMAAWSADGGAGGDDERDRERRRLLRDGGDRERATSKPKAKSGPARRRTVPPKASPGVREREAAK